MTPGPRTPEDFIREYYAPLNPPLINRPSAIKLLQEYASHISEEKDKRIKELEDKLKQVYLKEGSIMDDDIIQQLDNNNIKTEKQ